MSTLIDGRVLANDNGEKVVIGCEGDQSGRCTHVGSPVVAQATLVAQGFRKRAPSEWGELFSINYDTEVGWSVIVQLPDGRYSGCATNDPEELGLMIMASNLDESLDVIHRGSNLYLLVLVLIIRPTFALRQAWTACWRPEKFPEGAKIAGKRRGPAGFWWAVHNLVSHPLSEVAGWLRPAWGHRIHDWSIPRHVVGTGRG